MKAGCPINTLHACMANAAYKAFPLYEYEDRDWQAYSKGETKTIKKVRQHTDYDLSVEAMFPQTWGSTALGFGGIGGAAITTAYVIIISSDLNGMHAVYFGGQLAYVINRPNEKFWEDVLHHRMVDAKLGKKTYEREQTV